MGSWKSSPVGNCCHGCTDRYPACHDHCEKYLEARDKWIKEKKAIYESSESDRIFDRYHFRRIQIARKIRREKNLNG